MKIEITEEMREAAAEVILSEHLMGRARTRAEARHWSTAAERHRAWLGGAVLKAIFPSPRSAPEIVEEMLAGIREPEAMHVTVHMGTGRLECARCGASARIALPCFVQDFRLHLVDFCREHAECKKGGGDARCQRLEAAAEALDALTAWAGEMRAYLPSKAQEEIDAAEEALERLRGETP